ncbi:type 1 glutamine amidotransferase [Streptomyces guryensis]|uniref:Type 1 glutamine amidotransferase n=1 Tax=Streptomyces guryensis TaxID=2886947 RepID=A0A9Q3VWH1_9ACTN|nr:type 1 glutamine amidotransferase [Streptomyces guryensis]MCD9878914.1 type 1 glutamine amidotransferase [Streptomyces guryensis]
MNSRTHFHRPPRIAVLQHAGWEKPGTFGRLLAERGATLVPVRVDEGALPPPPSSVHGILAMGGPMSVNDPLPWLAPEKDYIRTAVRLGVPFFGVCLGAQLLAAACGATVRPADPHYGMHQVRLEPGAFDDPLFGGLSRNLPVFQWHGENFDRPAGATALAGSPGCPYEAIRVGASAYGVQFHLELDPRLLAEWLAIPGCASELIDRCGADAPHRMTEDLLKTAVRMERYARRIFGGWADLVAQRAESRSGRFNSARLSAVPGVRTTGGSPLRT